MQDLQHLGSILYQSNVFKDIRGAQQAIVKVLAGAEIGLGPIASMTAINIVQGKPAFSANLIASKIKSHSNYDYKTVKVDEKGCTVEIFQLDPKSKKLESIGDFTFAEEDAKRAGLLGKDNWKKYPKAMYFSRAISQAARLFCPDVFHSVIPYTVEELEPDIKLDETGEIVEGQVTVVPEILPEPPTAPTPEAEIITAEEAAPEVEPYGSTETTEPPPKKEGPPEGKPWMDPSLSIADNRNVLYAWAMENWGYAGVDDIRETVIESGKFTGRPPIPDLATLDLIALHLLEVAPNKESPE
jgi:hypothetical protein